MKFAQYLEETLTPEWKKAYIDYRGLKKKISAIRKSQEASSPDNEILSPTLAGTPNHISKGPGETPASGSRPDEGPSHSVEAFSGVSNAVSTPGALENELRRLSTAVSTQSSTADRPGPSVRRTSVASAAISTRGGLYRRTSSIIGNALTRTFTNASQTPQEAGTSSSVPVYQNNPLPLGMLLPILPSNHLPFFEQLDNELRKVENFYIERENEAKTRMVVLREQLEELQDHRRLFYQVNAPNQKSSLWPPGRQRLPQILEEDPIFVHRRRKQQSLSLAVAGNATSYGATDQPQTQQQPQQTGRGKASQAPSVTDELDPDEYHVAKKKLKKAVIEFYRGLEVLRNYRIMNLTGFRKALKKYEKVTKVIVQNAYFNEKIESCTFASGAKLEDMIKEVESLYAARFERGNKKKAMVRLRAGAVVKSHHFSAARSGFMLGLSLPAVVMGIWLSFQEETRASIPGWRALLFAYAIISVPVFFSLLAGVDLVVWAKARINYSFIFELDLRTKLTFHEYFELPAFLLLTLSYAFLISFSRLGADNVSPQSWPLIWLIFSLAIMLLPMPYLYRSSRWWLLKRTGKLLVPGLHHVEFTDFWLGDQFCSLVFTLSNLYFFFCAYDVGFDVAWDQCSKPRAYIVPFFVGTLPFTIRFLQSLRRYVDSKLITHLINAGKYFAGIIYYFAYFYWRHHNGEERAAPFVFYVLFGVLYAIYACAWDILMDWSLMQRNSVYPLLRKNLAYTNAIPLYYFAMISNLAIRFIWVFYLPIPGPAFALRSFIAALLEMLRRIQWNFYRLENEHMGNMDQYRVTRDVPLPYQFDDPTEEREDVAEDKDVDSIAVHSQHQGRSGWGPAVIRRATSTMSRISRQQEQQQRQEEIEGNDSESMVE